MSLNANRPAATHWRRWLPFAAVALVHAVVATHRIDLPGIFADAVNPDYLVARILYPEPQRSITWVLLGNSLLGDRAPVLISLYHGSQQFWLGLPLYAVFGTTVEGVRLVHATFALGVLAALYALLLRGGIPSWFAAAVGVALALDPSFSYAFRTQAYITMAPAAWLLLGVACLMRARDAREANATRWLFASGALCGLAAVGYFVWAFVLPAIAFAAWHGMRGLPLRRPPVVTWTLGLAAGGAAYPLGYLLIARKLGSVSGMAAFVRDTQASLGAFGSVQPLDARLWHAWRMLDATVSTAWHSGIMFGGDTLAIPGSGWKLAALVGLPYALWLLAEVRRRATPLLRLLVALPVSFVAMSLVFGDRLGGHHFVTLVPLCYAALGVSLWTFVAQASRGTLAAALGAGRVPDVRERRRAGARLRQAGRDARPGLPFRRDPPLRRRPERDAGEAVPVVSRCRARAAHHPADACHRAPHRPARRPGAAAHAVRGPRCRHGAHQEPSERSAGAGLAGEPRLGSADDPAVRPGGRNGDLRGADLPRPARRSRMRVRHTVAGGPLPGGPGPRGRRLPRVTQ